MINLLVRLLDRRCWMLRALVWVIVMRAIGTAVADDRMPATSQTPFDLVVASGEFPVGDEEEDHSTEDLFQPVTPVSWNLIEDVRKTRTSDSLLSQERFQQSSLHAEAGNEDGFMLPIGFDTSYVTGGSYNVTSIGLSGMVPVWMSGEMSGQEEEKGDMVAFQLEVTTTFLDVDSTLDVPGTLYNLEGGLMWNHHINDRWSTMAMVGLGVQSDLQTSTDAFNVSGIGMARWKWREDVNLSFGAAVMNQDNFPILPAVGIEWTPSDEWQIMLGLPETRIARRIDWFGMPTGSPEDGTWLYLAPGLGGGTWAVKRADGRADRITLQEFAATIGIERRSEDGPAFTMELGYVFSRQIEYEVFGDKQKFDDGISFRVSMSY